MQKAEAGFEVSNPRRMKLISGSCWRLRIGRVFNRQCKFWFLLHPAETSLSPIELPLRATPIRPLGVAWVQAFMFEPGGVNRKSAGAIPSSP